MQRAQESVDREDWVRYFAQAETTSGSLPKAPDAPRTENAVEDIFGRLSVSESAESGEPKGEHAWPVNHENWAHVSPGSMENSSPFSAKSPTFPSFAEASQAEIWPGQGLASPHGLPGSGSREVTESSKVYRPTPYDATRSPASPSHIRSPSEISISSITSPSQPVFTSPSRKPVPDTPDRGVKTRPVFGVEASIVLEHDRLFDRWRGNDSSLGGSKAAPLFKKSRLDDKTLSKIWTLSGGDSTGHLGRDEFQVAMFLIIGCLNGRVGVLTETAAASIKEDVSQTRWRPAKGAPQGSLTISSRIEYDTKCISSILPTAEEFLKEKKTNFAAVPQGFGESFPVKSPDPLDDFDDNDLSDDEDMVTHRIDYHRSRIIVEMQQNKWQSAVEQLDACGFPRDLFKIRVARAILNNLTADDTKIFAKDILKDLVYSAQYGVLTNLLMYYNRALSHYLKDDAENALTDCKRGLKLAKKSNLSINSDTEAGRLMMWARSDIGELAARISSDRRLEADAEFYRKLVFEPHETHPRLEIRPADNAAVPDIKATAKNFLVSNKIPFDPEFPPFELDEKVIFKGFITALAKDNYAAAYCLIEANPYMTNENSKVPLPPHKAENIHSSSVGSANQPPEIYPYGFLHYIAAYPEATCGRLLVEYILSKGISVNQCPGDKDSPKKVNGQSIGSPANYSPLGMATVFKNIDVMKVLISHGASYELSMATNFPSSILLAAYLCPRIGSLEPLEYLVSLDPDLTRLDYWENTVFYYIANLGNIRPVCKPNADISAALMTMLLALRSLLSCRKKDLKLVSKGGETALDVVRRNKMMPGVAPMMKDYYAAVEQMILDAPL